MGAQQDWFLFDGGLKSLSSPYKVPCLQVSHLYTSVEIFLTNSKLLQLFFSRFSES